MRKEFKPVIKQQRSHLPEKGISMPNLFLIIWI